MNHEVHVTVTYNYFGVKCLVILTYYIHNVMILSSRTDRSRQTVQTQIRLLLEEQSDQSLHCLLFNLHLFDKIPLKLSF